MKSGHTMTSLRDSMRNTTTRKGVHTILNIARRRLADVEFIGWPALEESLKRELTDCLTIARERGFAV